MGETQAGADPELRRVRAQYERNFEAGETIFDPGDPARELYIVQAGEVEVLRPTGSGTRPVDRVRPGEFFGEMSVVLGGRRSVRAIAVTPARVLEIDRETFQSMCLDRPEIALRVIERLTVRVLQLEERMGTLAVTELIRTVVTHLVEAATAEAEDHRVDASLKEIAERSGLSMLDAHRAIQELIDLKVVRLENDLLRIPDLDALRAYPDAQPNPAD